MSKIREALQVMSTMPSPPAEKKIPRAQRKDPLETAEARGAIAARAGLPEFACPYKDKRQLSGKLTWSRAYRNAWIKGYRWAKQSKS